MLMILRKGCISKEVRSDVFEGGEIYNVNILVVPSVTHLAGATRLESRFGCTKICGGMANQHGLSTRIKSRTKGSKYVAQEPRRKETYQEYKWNV